MAKILDIAVGILVDARGRLLIAQRRPGTLGAGRWEFPGGKREPGESMAHCLARELAEEIGIGVCRTQPLIRFVHARGPRPVRLHVWRIPSWSGQPCGREGQRLRWAALGELAAIALLPASDVIINALALPRRYAITPPVAAFGRSAWLAAIERALADGIGLLRVRDHALDDGTYAAIAAAVIARAQPAGARVLIDRDAAMAVALGADGLHWPCARLADGPRPPDGPPLLAVSAHGAEELARAAARGADFATLSPVAATPSDAHAKALGWAGWRAARGDHALPVYALGGLGAADIDRAIGANAQGVAAIRGFWPG